MSKGMKRYDIEKIICDFQIYDKMFNFIYNK